MAQTASKEASSPETSGTPLSRRRILLSALVTVTYLTVLALWLRPRMPEIGTAIGEVAPSTFLAVVVLALAQLLCRTEMWLRCVRACGAQISRLDTHSITAALGPVGLVLHPYAGSAMRIIVVRRLNRQTAPTAGQLVAAEASAGLVELMLAVVLLIAATATIGLFPVWLTVGVSAAVILLGVALLSARARLPHRASLRGFDVLFTPGLRWQLFLLAAMAFGCQLARYWIILDALGLSPSFFEVAGAFLISGVLSPLLIGPTAATATAPIVVFGDQGLALAAAAGTILAATALVAGLIYSTIGLRLLSTSARTNRATPG